MIQENRAVELGEVLGYLDDRVLGATGASEATISSVAPVLPGAPNALSFVARDAPRAREMIEKTSSAVVLVEGGVLHGMGALPPGHALIAVEDPRLEFARIMSEFFAGREPATGIHPTAQLAKGAHVEAGCTIEAGVVLEGDVQIGEGSSVGANSVIRRGTTIGRGVKIGPCCVIGEAGFGFATDLDGTRIRMPHIGGVEIGNGVEIGAYTAVDRGTMSNTVIEAGAKIDKYVYIAHNCHIGERAMVIGAVTLGGGARVGADSWVAPNSTVKEKVQIGDGATVGLATVVLRDVNPHETVFGHPGRVVARD